MGQPASIYGAGRIVFNSVVFGTTWTRWNFTLHQYFQITRSFWYWVSRECVALTWKIHFPTGTVRQASRILLRLIGLFTSSNFFTVFQMLFVIRYVFKITELSLHRWSPCIAVLNEQEPSLLNWIPDSVNALARFEIPMGIYFFGTVKPMLVLTDLNLARTTLLRFSMHCKRQFAAMQTPATPLMVLTPTSHCVSNGGYLCCYQKYVGDGLC